jgi:hypothetical protein
MPIIKNRPLPDTHPFKNGCVVFGKKKPKQTSSPYADINSPETEEEGYHQEQLRREKLRRMRSSN